VKLKDIKLGSDYDFGGVQVRAVAFSEKRIANCPGVVIRPVAPDGTLREEILKGSGFLKPWVPKGEPVVKNQRRPQKLNGMPAPKKASLVLERHKRRAVPRPGRVINIEIVKYARGNGSPLRWFAWMSDSGKRYTGWRPALRRYHKDMETVIARLTKKFRKVVAL